MSIGAGIAFAGFVFALSYLLTGGIKVSVDIGSIYNTIRENTDTKGIARTGKEVTK